MASHTCTLKEAQITKLYDLLSERNWQFCDIPYAYWRAQRGKVNVTAYQSGKVHVQGKEIDEVIQTVIEPYITKKATWGYELHWAQQDSPEMFQPHIGMDESGKGDYFGPLVISAVFVDTISSAELFELGVEDSKAIQNAKKISDLAQKIMAFGKNSYSLVVIGPEAYNRMIENMGNVNDILAWGHARSLENILEKQPGCKRAVLDQFSRKSVVTQALMKQGKKIHLEQRTKAESDIAVAAASVLARNGFLRSMDALEKQIGHSLPKGASRAVTETARDLISSHGLDYLKKFAKIHFRTTTKALSMVKA